MERDGIERKAVIGQGSAITEWSGASRQDGTNFRTNQVTLAEFDDGGMGSASSALSLSTAYACVNLLAGTIASLPLMIYRSVNGQRTTATDHPLYYVLHDSPNADQTALDFWELMDICVELKGNAYSVPEFGSGRRVIALSPPIDPDAMTVRRLPSGDLEYRWSEDGRQRTARQDEILHIRGFGGGPLGGLSTLAFARRSFGIAKSIEVAAQSTFRNGIRPSIGLETDKNLNAQQVKEARESLDEKYAGAMNAGQPFLVHSGMKIKPISINPEEAQMLESRAFGVEEICRFFGVPPFMVGHTEKSTSWGTGIEQQTIGFVQFTLRRRLKRIEQALMKQLLTPQDRLQGVTIEFNLEGLLRGDSKTRADFYASGLQNGWRTINEVRALENLPPVEGGDVPRMQMQNVPITEAGQLPAGVSDAA